MEINQLESIYECKILFVFDNHFSLHEPLINVINEKSVNIKTKKNDSSNKIITKKKSVKKKTTLKKKEIKIKPRKKKLKNKKLDDSLNLNDDKNLQENLSKKTIAENKDIKKKISSEANEKSGWWQE